MLGVIAKLFLLPGLPAKQGCLEFCGKWNIPCAVLLGPGNVNPITLEVDVLPLKVKQLTQTQPGIYYH